MYGMSDTDKVLIESLQYMHKRLFKEKQRRADVVDRKERNKETTCTVVKATWNAFCKPEAHDLKLKEMLLELNKAVTEAYMLANLHVLRLCEAGLPVPELCQTFFYQCLSSVSLGERKRSEVKDLQLRHTIDMYDSCKPVDYQMPQCSYLSSGLFQQASQQMVIATRNSTSINFYRRFRRYLKIRYRLDGSQAYHALKQIQADEYTADNVLVLHYRHLMPPKPKYGPREDTPELVMPLQYRFLKFLESVEARRFTLLPMKQGFECSHIKVCSSGLQGLLKRSKINCIVREDMPIPLPNAMPQFRGMVDEVWRYLFNIDKFETATRKFAGEILTDGKAVSIVLRKPKSGGARATALDFNAYDQVWGLDPGRREVYVASDSAHQVKRCSTKKYYDDCGFKRSNKKIEVWYQDKDNKVLGRLAGEVLKDIPCKKTGSIDSFKQYITYTMTCLHPLLQFHMKKRFRNLKFSRYVLRQKVIHKMCQDISGTKGEKVLVGFGDWSAKDNAGIIKKCPAGPVKRFEQQLRRYCTVVSVNEYMTSQTCERCHCKLNKTHMHKHWNRRSDKPTGDVKENDSKVYSILFCANRSCRMLVNRDVNASQNILACLKCQLTGQERPPALCRTSSVTQRCCLPEAVLVV